MKKFWLKTIRLSVGFLIFVVVFVLGSWYGIKNGIPFVSSTGKWAIGIVTGTSPLGFLISPYFSNPVLEADDIRDVSASFIADPFIIVDKNKWYMFFEVFNDITDQGDIGLATSSDGLNWNYVQIVLDESFHLSYPMVFEYSGDYFMIPESREAGEVRLYRARKFPFQWEFRKVLLRGSYADSTVVFYNSKWWLFTLRGYSELLVYYSDELESATFLPHSKNPIIVGNNRISRPGGRMIVYDGCLIRYAQDGYPHYGTRIRAFCISELTPSSYSEEEIGDIGIGPGKFYWNKKGMHHIDPFRVDENKWIGVVDGFSEQYKLGW